MCAAFKSGTESLLSGEFETVSTERLVLKRAHGDSPTLREELGFPSLGKQFESGEVWE